MKPSSKKTRTLKMNSNQQNKNKEKKTMKNLKKVNYKKIIETVKTIIIYTAIVAGVAFYFSMKQGEANTKVNNDKLVEIIRNLDQNK